MAVAFVFALLDERGGCSRRPVVGGLQDFASEQVRSLVLLAAGFMLLRPGTEFAPVLVGGVRGDLVGRRPFHEVAVHLVGFIMALAHIFARWDTTS